MKFRVYRGRQRCALLSLLLCFLECAFLFTGSAFPMAAAEETPPSTGAAASVLMEAESGRILFCAECEPAAAYGKHHEDHDGACGAASLCAFGYGYRNRGGCGNRGKLYVFGERRAVYRGVPSLRFDAGERQRRGRWRWRSMRRAVPNALPRS